MAQAVNKTVLNDVARDIVAIVAAILTLLAFTFALWATAATLRQAKHATASEERIMSRLEILEEQILAQLKSA